jgi:HEAT repeat protein
MGAIGDAAALPVLRKYLTHSNKAISETCEIALDKVVWDNSEEGKSAEPKCVFELLSSPFSAFLCGY